MTQETSIDVASDPCAIIARSTCGTATFFMCYGYLALDHGVDAHGFWLSLCLGLIGCMAIVRKNGPKRP